MHIFKAIQVFKNTVIQEFNSSWLQLSKAKSHSRRKLFKPIANQGYSCSRQQLFKSETIQIYCNSIQQQFKAAAITVQVTAN
jgi:hypothetical protein